MRCGLFGKLGARRDFIALATPRSFLEIWEPWVQSCVSASRHQLDRQWQDAFLTAPVWRFWLGANICGTTVTGAVMPSVDGIGRYYPLTLLAAADPQHSIPPPDLNAQDEWFRIAEKFLLSTLDQNAPFDMISAALDVLSVPETRSHLSTSPETIPIDENMVGAIAAGESLKDTLFRLRCANYGAYAAATFWWTAGGGEFPPMGLCCRGMPDPFRYSVMLTGRLDGERDAT
jgi:type VI secretion system protein ImpM